MGNNKSKSQKPQGTVNTKVATPAPMNNAQKAVATSKPAAAAAQSKAFKDLYKLGKELGKGNYSVVRLATDIATGEMVAVKCMVKKALTQEDTDALKIEVAILKEVSHPTIIKMYGFFEDPVDFYLVTELMKGGELFDRIVTKEFYSENDAQSVVKTLADCIKYLHDKDIVHRDLKPENILLKDQTNDAAIKLADFGFARHVKEGCTTACGTPGYVAPEIINGKPYGKSVDVWSLGVITYILLCGYPPFYNKNQKLLFKSIREGTYEFEPAYWDAISEDAKMFIRGMLCVDTNKRLTIDDVLRHKWVRDTVSSVNMAETTLKELKKFNARRKLRAGIRAAIAANKIMAIAEKLKQAN